MGRKFKPIPRRTKTKTEQRSDYVKSLAQKPVSATKEYRDWPDTGSTNFKPDLKAPTPPPEKVPKPSKLKNINVVLGIVGGAIFLISILIGIGIKYNWITSNIENIKDDLSDFKSDTRNKINSMETDLKNDLRHLTERIDKYISSEKEPPQKQSRQ